MGVGFNVGGESVGASWAYSGFGRFRERLAAELGLVLKEMYGFGGDRSWDMVHDPLKPLLHHSDCDGILSPEECASVAPRLLEIVSRWPDTQTVTVNPEFRKEQPHYPEQMVLDDYDKSMALLLIKGMRRAVELDEPLVFC